MSHRHPHRTTAAATRPRAAAVVDRKASKGSDYAHDNNRSAEGNDASLTTGPAFVRRVSGDGGVDAPPDPARDTADSTGPGHDARAIAHTRTQRRHRDDPA